MRNDDKKRIEKYLLTSFMKHAAIPASIVDAPEPPDFIIEHEGRRIGVELTETFIEVNGGSHSRQAQENKARRIMQKAHAFHKTLWPSARVNVQVNFFPGRIRPNENLEETAQQLALLVGCHPVSPGQAIVLRSEEYDDEFPDSVARVRIYGLDDHGPQEQWTEAGAGWVAPLTRQHIEERIEAKAKRLPKYRNVIAENWLVIATKGSSPSQFFNRDSLQSLGSFASPFERTYFFDNLSGTVISLTAQAPIAPQ